MGNGIIITCLVVLVLIPVHESGKSLYFLEALCLKHNSGTALDTLNFVPCPLNMAAPHAKALKCEQLHSFRTTAQIQSQVTPVSPSVLRTVALACLVTLKRYWEGHVPCFLSSPYLYSHMQGCVPGENTSVYYMYLRVCCRSLLLYSSPS